MKTKFTKFLLISLFIFVLLIGYKALNIDDGGMMYMCIYFMIFLFNLIVDTIVLSIIYTILRKGAFIQSLKFVIYLVSVAVAGLLVFFLVNEDIATAILKMFALIFLFNFVFSRLCFKLKNTEACIVGLVMGIINPAYIIILLGGLINTF